VPIISTFFGIVIRMVYKDHEPAYFHAEHQGQQNAGRALERIAPLE